MYHAFPEVFLLNVSFSLLIFNANGVRLRTKCGVQIILDILRGISSGSDKTTAAAAARKIHQNGIRFHLDWTLL